MIVAVEARASRRVGPADARSLSLALPHLRAPGTDASVARLGIVVSRGTEVGELAPAVWAVPDFILFGG
jgi:hypothetical protein